MAIAEAGVDEVVLSLPLLVDSVDQLTDLAAPSTKRSAPQASEGARIRAELSSGPTAPLCLSRSAPQSNSILLRGDSGAVG